MDNISKQVDTDQDNAKYVMTTFVNIIVVVHTIINLIVMTFAQVVDVSMEENTNPLTEQVQMAIA